MARKQLGVAPNIAEDAVTVNYFQNNIAGYVYGNVIDTKGDLIVGTGSDAWDNLPAGADGLALVADSSQSMGLKWAPANRYVGVNAQTGTSYTVVLADEGKLVTLTNAGAITVTLPQDSSVAIPIGGSIDFVVRGAGMATFVAGTGVNPIEATPSTVTRAQYSGCTATKVAANTWWVVGDLA